MLPYDQIIKRNIGVFTRDQQERLQRSTVAIAGVGGVGGIAAERLARLGIGHIKIADPEVFEPTNFNRQFGSGQSTLDQNKAEVVGQLLLDINPALDLTCYNKGVTTENVEAFVSGADVVVDAIDYNILSISIELHKVARVTAGIQGIVSAFAVGFGSTMLVFSPTGMTLEEYLGLPINTTEDDIRAFRIPIDKVCPELPSYADPAAVMKILEGSQPYMPTVSVGCAMAGSLIATEVVSILLGLRESHYAPALTSIDLVDGRAIFGRLQS